IGIESQPGRIRSHYAGTCGKEGRPDPECTGTDGCPVCGKEAEKERKADSAWEIFRFRPRGGAGCWLRARPCGGDCCCRDWSGSSDGKYNVGEGCRTVGGYGRRR